MYGVFCRMECKPEKFQDMVDFMTWDAEVCRDEEPGTVRFEFYQDPENQYSLYVYEAYQDQEAFAVHMQNEPFRRFNSGRMEELGATITVLVSGDALFSPTD